MKIVRKALKRQSTDSMSLRVFADMIAASVREAMEVVAKIATLDRADIKHDLGVVNAEIKHDLGVANTERDIKLDKLADKIESHAESAKNALSDHTFHEDARFSSIEANTASLAVAVTALTSISQDVKSLLETRTFTRGMVKMLTVVAGCVSAVAMALLGLLAKHFWPFAG